MPPLIDEKFDSRITTTGPSASIELKYIIRGSDDDVVITAALDAEAPGAVHDDGLAMYQRQHTLFRTCPYACTAANALREVDVGMLQARSVAASLARQRTLAVTSRVRLQLDAPRPKNQNRKPKQQRRGEYKYPFSVLRNVPEHEQSKFVSASGNDFMAIPSLHLLQ